MDDNHLASGSPAPPDDVVQSVEAALLEVRASLENNKEYCKLKCGQRLFYAWESSKSVTLSDVMMLSKNYRSTAALMVNSALVNVIPFKKRILSSYVLLGFGHISVAAIKTYLGLTARNLDNLSSSAARKNSHAFFY